MDEVVAVAVTLEDGAARYSLTHGRIFDPVDTAPIEAAVLKFASGCDLGAAPARAEVCTTLQDASQEPYFFEALVEMSRDFVSPSSLRYGRWKKKVAKGMSQGREIWFLGRPRT